MHLANICQKIGKKVHPHLQSLVRLEVLEYLIEFDVIDRWETYLNDMNKDKTGLGAVSLS
ncbi:MAG TPA: hypothetical protein VN703_10375 [Candidatus Sulfopaludibacter sp.]|nr:hypothetical protein [Candidatus Sulfopaludibacter sp.]